MGYDRNIRVFKPLPRRTIRIKLKPGGTKLKMVYLSGTP